MSASTLENEFKLLNTRPEYFSEIQELCRRVYPFSKPWSLAQLEAHRAYFPDGQLIVIEKSTGKVVGLAFSLIISWNDYSHQDNWQDFTSGGYFHNHDPRRGKTLYGAEVMVDPGYRGKGIGKLLYRGRQEIAQKYNLKRIRAGARLRGYSKFSEKLSPEEYVKKVVQKEIYDPTLSFQLSQGFVAIGVAKNYLLNDPESLGYAAVIEWLNHDKATEKDIKKQKDNVELFLSGQNYIPEYLPKELRRLVRQSTQILGQIIKEFEGNDFYKKIEHYRDDLKKTRNKKDTVILKKLLAKLTHEETKDRLKIAHAFSLQLELVNACETAYRTWRLRQKPWTQGYKSKIPLTYVLTAHPTESRSSITVKTLGELSSFLIDGMQKNFIFKESELRTKISLLWLQPLSKIKKPSVVDEANYIYSIIFSSDVFDFLLSEHPNFEIKLRTWVGGDKDGHPGVNKDVMKACLTASRQYIINNIIEKIGLILKDLQNLQQVGQASEREIHALKMLSHQAQTLSFVKAGDGNKVKVWCLKFRSLYTKAKPFLKNHKQILLLKKLLDLFPALVLPIELREEAEEIKNALEKPAPIQEMLLELGKIAGSLNITYYARELIISRCESANDLKLARKLVMNTPNARNLPIVPLFESSEALTSAKSILLEWLSTPQNLRTVRSLWNNRFEVMLGYSDSAKQVGALSSRHLIRKTMRDIEKTLKSKSLIPVFFHGSGGSVARGGGSIKEQISWWSNSAIKAPKLTVQGEMIPRLFATSEILNSQCFHLTQEAFRRRVQKSIEPKSPELEYFVSIVEKKYIEFISNQELLQKVLDTTPYKYLDLLKIGSRPTKRPSSYVSIDSLRAISWNLCWTQTRVLLPTWWGIGTAWEKMLPAEKEKLKLHFQESDFFSSFVKTLGFSLAKVELPIFELYLDPKKSGLEDFYKTLQFEFENSVKFVKEVSQKNHLIWHRPWLEESIRLRSPHIHILNLLQILAMKNLDDDLLRETMVGIASGMLTTG